MDRLISEKQVLDAVDKVCRGSVEYRVIYDRCEELIKAIPSAEPKTGHWIIIDDCEKFIAKCSECGQIEDSRMIGKYAYCHCGARMVDEQERIEE